MKTFVLLQDQYSSSSFFLRFASGGKIDDKEIRDLPKSWVSQLRNYCLRIVDRRKSFLPPSSSQEIFVSGKTFRDLVPFVYVLIHEVMQFLV